MVVVNKMNGDSTARGRQIVMRMGHVEPEWQEKEQKGNRGEAKSGKILNKAEEEPAGTQTSGSSQA